MLVMDVNGGASPLGEVPCGTHVCDSRARRRMRLPTTYASVALAVDNGMGEPSQKTARGQKGKQYQSGTKGAGPVDFSNATRFKASYIYKVSKEYRLSLSSEVFYRPVYSNYEWSDTRGRISVRKKISKRRHVTFGFQLERPRFGPDPWVEHAIICNFSLEKKRRKSDK